MSRAKELYISLRDDPDLNVPEGETRESAAWNEMSQRMRQHQSNAKALSMAAPKADSVSKLLTFLEKADEPYNFFTQDYSKWTKKPKDAAPKSDDKPLNPGNDVPANEREYLSGGREAPEGATVLYGEDNKPFYDKREVANKTQQSHDNITEKVTGEKPKGKSVGAQKYRDRFPKSEEQQERMQAGKITDEDYAEASGRTVDEVIEEGKQLSEEEFNRAKQEAMKGKTPTGREKGPATSYKPTQREEEYEDTEEQARRRDERYQRGEPTGQAVGHRSDTRGHKGGTADVGERQQHLSVGGTGEPAKPTHRPTEGSRAGQQVRGRSSLSERDPSLPPTSTDRGASDANLGVHETEEDRKKRLARLSPEDRQKTDFQRVQEADAEVKRKRKESEAKQRAKSRAKTVPSRMAKLNEKLAALQARIDDIKGVDRKPLIDPKKSTDELLKFLDSNPFMDKNSFDYIMLYKAQTAADKVYKNIMSGQNPYKVTINGEERTINHGIHTGASAPEEGHNFDTDSSEHKFRSEYMSKLNTIHQSTHRKRWVTNDAGERVEERYRVRPDEDAINEMKDLRQEFWQAREDHDDIQHDIWTNTEGKSGRERPPEPEPENGADDNDNNDNEEPQKNEHGVSHDLHKHIGDWFNELNNRHGANINDAANSFRDMRGYLAMKIARNELTKDDIKGIQEHFANHPSDFNHLRNDWKDNDGNSKWDNDLFREYNEHSQSTGSGGGGGGGSDNGNGDNGNGDNGNGDNGNGDNGNGGNGGPGPSNNNNGNGDNGNGNNDDDDPDRTRREAAARKIIEEDEHIFREEYEAEYGDSQRHTFEQFIDDHVETASGSDKASNKFRKDRAKAAHKWNKKQEANKSKAEQDERNKHAQELVNRVSDKGMKKMSMREAHRLLDEHDGDVNAAFNAHSKAASDAFKKKDEAGNLPYSIDELSKKVFGDVDPNSNFTHLSDDRKKNKFGQVSTTLARELLAHHRKYAGEMDKKTEQTLIDQLAFLQDPSTRFPNMKIPKGEEIGADIKAALAMVDEAIAAGLDPQSPEAQKIYDKREAQRNRRMQHHQGTHVNPDTKEKKEESHGEGADPNEGKKGVFSETDNTSFLEFDENGKVTHRKRKLGSGGEHNENFKDDGSDDHHHRGDHNARGSRVKEHVTPSHGSNLTNKEKESLDALREAHKAKETAERDGDEGAASQADEDIARHTQDLTAGDAGLEESDFLHDEDDRPQIGPPDPQVAAHMRAQGLEWNEAIRHWVDPETYGKRQGDTSVSHVGTGEAMGIHHAEVNEDGTITQSHAMGTFMQTGKGLFGLDHSADTIPSTKSGVQAQKLGTIGSIKDAASKSSESGNTHTVATRDHAHLTGHAGGDEGTKPDLISRAGKWWRGEYADKPKAKPKSKPGSTGFGDRIKDLFKENAEGLTASQLLQVHIELQKLEEKAKTVV